jgi:hypothetical protein
MHQGKVVKGRWQTLNIAEKFFTVVIASSVVGGFVLIALEASGLVALLGILG